MEIIKRTISFSQFEYADVNLSGDTITTFGSQIPLDQLLYYDESTLNYVELANTLYSRFPLIQFNTFSGLTQDFTTVVTTERHELKVGDRVLLYPLFGQMDIISATTVTYLGDSFGSNPDYSFIMTHPFNISSNGLLLKNLDYILSFFKGFNLQPTTYNINYLFPYLERYLNDSPDLIDVDDTSIGEFYRNTPRNLFNDLGYVLLTSGGTSGATFNIPIYLTQTIDNLGLYTNTYSGITDNKDILVNDILLFDPNLDTRNQDLFIVTGTTIFSPNISNNFPFRIWDGITGNTINDFYDIGVVITGMTTNMSKRVVKYVGDDVRYQYKLSDTLTDITYTINPNLIPGINNNSWVEYTTPRPVRDSNTSYLSYTSYGLSPNNVNIDFNTGRTKDLSIVFDEFKMGMVQEPKITNDLFIDKGVFSVFEKIERFSDMLTLDDLESYENGGFNLVNDQPKVNRYIIKTNG